MKFSFLWLIIFNPPTFVNSKYLTYIFNKGGDNMSLVDTPQTATTFNYTIATYQKILNGEIKSFSPYFFELRYRKKRICELVRYLVEEILKITPEEALTAVDLKVLKKYKLDCLLKYVEKPVELDKNDVSHLIIYAYKGKVPEPTPEELTIRLYKKVLSGELKNFPKNYFLDGAKGEERVKYCIKYLCFDILKLKKEEIPKKLTAEVLKQYKLKIVLNVLYLSMYDLITSVFPGEFTNEDFK